MTVQFARQITVLSLPALRRLRFPVADKSKQDDANIEARTTLAALALAAVARQWASGFSLRSRCDLVPRGELVFSLLSPGREEMFQLHPDAASILLEQAVGAAIATGLPWLAKNSELPWKDGCVTLTPSSELAAAVAQSRRLAAEDRE